jgi:hypothetical protein
MLPPTDCIAFGGTPQGVNTRCLGHEACCLPDGSCTFVDRLCCDDLGGAPLGAGTMCAGTGACCFDIDDGPLQYDTCIEMDQVCCEAQGGVFGGVGTTCGSEACCLPGGFCQEADPLCCLSSGGTPKGPGSVCLGDNNGNGADDVCEPLCRPTPDGLACMGDCLPNEFCAPKVYRRLLDGTFILVECECRSTFDPFGCRIELELPVPPGGGPPICTGDCPFPPLSCTMFTTGYVNGTIDYQCRCADLVAPCSPTQTGDACVSACFDNALACVPTTIGLQGTGTTPTALECDCRRLDACRPAAPAPSSARRCLGGCPPVTQCDIKNEDVDGDGQIDIFSCNCVPPCAINAQCDDNDVCTCDQCLMQQCSHRHVEFGNVNCAGPDDTDLDDVLCALDGFANINVCPNADLHPPCTGNNVISLDDLLLVLDAFAGLDPCNCEPIAP